ncbi:MAG: glycosyltransferase family 4 protein, partial [Anaerolineales bacterium]
GRMAHQPIMNIPSSTLGRNNNYSLLLFGSQMATGGAQQLLLDQGKWFAAKGYRVTAAFLYDKDGLHEQWQASVPFPLINLDCWGSGNALINFYRFVRGMIRLYKLMIRERFTLVEAFTHHANLIGIPCAWLARVPVRIASHHGRIENFPPWLERLHAWIINHGIATGMVAVSLQVQSLSIREERIQPDKIIVIANGINLSHVEQLEEYEQIKLRQQIGIKREDFLLLTVARLRTQKGHTYLLEAIPSIIECFPNTVFVFAGEGDLSAELKEKARSLGIQDAIRFLGNRTDVPKLLNIADGFVLPSLSEGLPLSLLEAMRAGLPVVATKLEGIEEIIRDGENGLLVEPADPKGLSQAIIRLLSNEELRKRLGSAGEALIKEQYTIDIMCKHYEQMFHEGLEVRG